MATLRKITLNWEIRTGAITCDTGYIKRQELCDVDLYVTVDGTAYALDTSWALNLSIKPTLLGDNAALIAVTTWTASATTGLYQATAQTMGGAALDTYLAANNSDTTDDEGNKLIDLDVYYTISTAVKSKSDTVTLILKPDVGRADDTVPATIIARNDFLVSNGTGLLVNVAAGYAANGAFVAAQASLAITNATNYIEVTAAGVASVNTTAFTAGSYPLATVVASAGAITANTDLRAWITPKPATSAGLTVGTSAITGGTTTRVLFDNAGVLGEYTISGTGSVAMTTSPTFTTPALGTPSALVGTNITGTASGLTAGNATLAATVTVANEATDTTCFPLFVTAATGSLAAMSSAGLTFNSATGLLSATGLAGAFNGTVGATTPSTVAGTTGTFSGAVTGLTFNAVPLNRGLGDAVRNVALGDYALAVSTTGNRDTAIGRGAMASVTIGDDNVAIGANSLFQNVSGNTNTAVGAEALFSATGSGNVALGYFAGFYETASDSLYIDNQNRTNTAGDKAKALIYGTFAATAATQQLTINAGTITLNGSAVTATSFAGAGSGLTALNASNVSSGTLAAARGGTGVSNTGTITLGGNLVTTGAFNTTFAQAATTTVTLPSTSATMARTDAAQTFTGVQTFANNILTTSANTINIGDSTNYYSRIFTDGTNYRNLLMRFAASVGGPGNCIYTTSNVLFQGNFYLTTGGLVSVLQQCVADGVMKLGNDNNTGFTRLNFGGNTSSFAALQTSGTGITAGLANGTAGGSFTASGTLAVTGATTLSAALITTPEALAPVLNAGAACGVTTVASGFALNGTNALTLANGTNGQIKTIVCTAVTAAGTATLTPTTCSGFTTVEFTAAGQTLTLQYFTTGGWVILSVRGATPA